MATSSAVYAWCRSNRRARRRCRSPTSPAAPARCPANGWADERMSAGRPSAREVAYRTLLRIDHDGAYANLLLRATLDRSKLADRDRRFVTELVNGTTRQRRACDALIDRFA